MSGWTLDFLLLAAIWGSSFLFMRIGTVEFGATAAAAVRVAIAAAVLVPLVLARGLGPQLRQHWRRILFVGVLNSGLPFLCFSFALLSITTGLSAILNATVPLFGAIVAWLWLKDRPSGMRMLGLGIGFLGVSLLAWDKASFKPAASGYAPGWAVLACLLATLSYGISANMAKRYFTGLSPLVTSAGSQLGATLALALPAALLWPSQAPSVHAWSALVAVGVLCTAFAYILYFRLIESGGPSRALAVTFVVPVFAVFYGALFLAEPVTAWMILCGLVIVCGTALSTGILAFEKARG